MAIFVLENTVIIIILVGTKYKLGLKRNNSCLLIIVTNNFDKYIIFLLVESDFKLSSPFEVDFLRILTVHHAHCSYVTFTKFTKVNIHM